MILTIAIPFLPLVFQFSGPAQQAPGQLAPEVILAAQRDADVHNYLAMRLRLLKRGTVVDEIKSEIVNQIDFGATSPRSVELLRRMMTLCDKAIASQAQMSTEFARLDQGEQKADAKAGMSFLGWLLLGAGTGGLLPAITALAELDRDDASVAKAGLQKQSTAQLGADISSLEFDLAALRSQVQAEGRLDAQEFVTASDYERFLTAAESPGDDERIAGIAKALVASPRLQPAALHLAIHFFRAGDSANCTRYADAAIATCPRILRRDALRAQAYALKAHLAVGRKDFAGAIAAAELGLPDDPSSALLLWAKATGLIFGGNHAGALAVYEQLALIVPQDPTIHYNLACCQAVAAKDADAALRSLRTALGRGFADITHAKGDADLALLREKRPEEFNAATSVQLKIRLLENQGPLLGPDMFEVTNESAFPLTEFELTLTFTGIPLTKRAPALGPLVKSVKLARLDVGKTFVTRELGQMLRTGFNSVLVHGTGPQGSFEKTYTPRGLE